MSNITKKESFLIEHNKLSPVNLQATISMLSQFEIEKASIFKDNNWSLDKLRRPFILWLTSADHSKVNKKTKTIKKWALGGQIKKG